MKGFHGSGRAPARAEAKFIWPANGTITNVGRETHKVPSILIVMRDQRNKLVAAVDLDAAKRAAKKLLGDGKLLVALAGRPTGM